MTPPPVAAPIAGMPRGTVVVVGLDPTVGREQHGLRPCVVVSDTIVSANQRFPLICVVPVTGTPGTGALYPSLAPGASGLRKTSYALVHHLRSVDKRRVVQTHGVLPVAELAAIDQGLKLYLGLT